MTDGENITTYVKEFHFTNDELAILTPLQNQKINIERAISEFVAKRVVPRFGLPPNKKFKVRFNLQDGVVRVKELVPHVELTKTNVKDILGWGPKRK